MIIAILQHSRRPDFVRDDEAWELLCLFFVFPFVRSEPPLIEFVRLRFGGEGSIDKMKGGYETLQDTFLLLEQPRCVLYTLVGLIFQ